MSSRPPGRPCTAAGTAVGAAIGSARPLGISSRLVCGLVLALCACDRMLPTTLPDGWLYVTGVTPTSAIVVWTGEPGAGVGCRDAAGNHRRGDATIRSSGLRYVRLADLQPDTAYRCRLEPDHGGRRDGGRRLRFRTAPATAPPASAAPFTFAAIGDTGDGSATAATLARRVLAGRPRFLLHLGDLAYPEATAARLDERFFRPYRRLLARVPLFPTPGNHDLSRSQIYREVFAPVYHAGDAAGLCYWFDWGDARLLSGSFAELARDDGAGRTWLAAALDAARPRPWRIVFLHEPPFTTSIKGTVPGLGRKLQWVLETGRVDLVLAGHAHMYERATLACTAVPAARVLTLISGGGGDASLERPRPHPNFPRARAVPHYLRVRVGPEMIEARAIGARGQTFDRVRHTHDPEAPCVARGWWWQPPAWSADPGAR